MNDKLNADALKQIEQIRKTTANLAQPADNTNQANTASANGNGNEDQNKRELAKKKESTYSPGYIPKSTSRSKAKDKGRSL